MAHHMPCYGIATKMCNINLRLQLAARRYATHCRNLVSQTLPTREGCARVYLRQLLRYPAAASHDVQDQQGQTLKSRIQHGLNASISHQFSGSTFYVNAITNGLTQWCEDSPTQGSSNSKQAGIAWRYTCKKHNDVAEDVESS